MEQLVMMIRNLVLTGLFTAAAVLAADVEEQKEILADKMFKNGGYHWTHSVLDTVLEFKLTPSCWEAANDPARGNFAHSIAWTNRAMREFFKRMDWTITTLDEMESNETGTPNQKRAKMKQTLQGIAPNFKVVLDASRLDCRTKIHDRLLGAYFFEATRQLESKWLPAGGQIQIVVVLDPTARAMKVSANADRSVITISGPTELETPGWSDRIVDGMTKFGR